MFRPLLLLSSVKNTLLALEGVCHLSNKYRTTSIRVGFIGVPLVYAITSYFIRLAPCNIFSFSNLVGFFARNYEKPAYIKRLSVYMGFIDISDIYFLTKPHRGKARPGLLTCQIGNW